jgi:nucleoside-diphosphate-sugar epimerase
LKKIKNDIQWEPKYSIERGIKDYIDNLALKN